MSSAAKAKISAKATGKPHPHKGHPISAEARAKLSASLKGKKMSAAARAKLAARMKGKKMSAATRAKLSAAMKGRKMSPATRAKLSAAAKLKAHGTPRPGGKPGQPGKPGKPNQPRRASSVAKSLKPKGFKVRGNAKLRRSSYRLLTATMHGHNHNLFKSRTRRHAIVIRRSARAHHMWRKRKRR